MSNFKLKELIFYISIFIVGFWSHCLISTWWSSNIPMDPFPEPAWRTKQTLSAVTIASTPFSRCEVHTVLTESGSIMTDWLWTDERSHVNILVHLKHEDKFVLFKQMKYGLDRPRFAVVGGLFNDGESPKDCAKRELEEELGLVATEMVNLGAYRVQVNRGGGYLHIFLAKDSYPSNTRKKSDDLETQEVKKFTRQELKELLLQGEIGEVQWTATAALGLMYITN
jgi:ADP-ribose pyrophosphatase YjhB (NUDIX family)